MAHGKRAFSFINSRCRFSNFNHGLRPIPESKGLPVIGTLLAIMAAGGAPKLHLYIDKRHKQHGIVFREKLGPVPGVFISDGNYMRKIFAAEGKYPKHIVPESWAIYNKIYKRERGLLFMDGKEWYHFRKLLNNIMLKNSDSDFARASSVVAKNMVQEWKHEKFIENLETRLYEWSLEVIVAILMGSETFQKHRSDVTEEIKYLSKITHQVFIESGTLSLMPTRLAVKLNFPTWKRFVKAAGSVNDSGQNLLGLILNICDKYPEKNGLLHKIKNNGIEGKDLNRIVTDLMLAAADTTSYTMQWLLHILSVNRHIQKLIQEEVDRLQESEAVSCPLLKGALKESLRLYPVAPFITRYAPEDINLDGYQIKAGELVLMSLYSSGRDEKYFPHPNSFSPQRWLRNTKGYQNVHNPNASLPFAMGSRSCIGKKIAETQILVTLFHILKNFNITTNHNEPIGITLHLISVPEKPINLILKRRNTPT